MNRFIEVHKVLLSIIMLLFLVTGIIGFIFYYHKTLSNIERGTYRIISQEVYLSEQISKLLFVDNKIVLFYEDEGYVALYTQNGVFLYGIQVDTSDKGTGNISYLDGYLVIKSKANSVYYFEGSSLVNVYHISSKNLDQYRLLEERMGDYNSLTHTTNGISFSASNGNIIKTDSSGGSTIMFPLPQKSMNPIFLLSFFLGVVLLFVLKRQ